MKIKNIITVLFIALILVSCAPAVNIVPTETAVPASTLTPIPPTPTITPTITPTPGPENLADAKDLPTWIDQYIHAFGGHVTVNDMDLDASQLTDEIRKNTEAFTHTKSVGGVEFLFLVINDVPLAMQEGSGQWKEVTMGNLSDLASVTFEYSERGMYPENTQLVEAKNIRITLTTALDMPSVFGAFTESDWKNVLDNWQTISQTFDDKKMPSDFPYDWSRGKQAISDAKSFFENPQFRSQALLDPSPALTLQSFTDLKNNTDISKEDMMKILEFTVKSRVLAFPEIDNWDATDEMVNCYVNELPEYRFWSNATGNKPSELAVVVGGWVKAVNPQAKTYITEDAIFDTSNFNAQWTQDYFYNTFLPDVAKINNGNIDGVIGENNWWIFEPQNWGEIEKQIDFINELGFEIGSSETMIVTGDIAINDDPKSRPKTIQISNREQAQAEMLRQWLKLYFGRGIKQIGFGGMIDDKSAWTNDVGNPDANPLLLDDNLKPKLAYYSVLQVLYEQLP